MNRWVMLLRGVNVGGHGKLPMAELRALLGELGLRNVQSYIQSGNVIFAGVIDARHFGEIVAEEVEERFGFRPRVLVLSAETFGAILDAYPWPQARQDPTSGHIWFLAARPDAPALDELEKLAAGSERFALAEGAFYLYAPDGIGRSKLAAAVEGALGVPATARNLNTVTKLTGLIAAMSGA